MCKPARLRRTVEHEGCVNSHEQRDRGRVIRQFRHWGRADRAGRDGPQDRVDRGWGMAALQRDFGGPPSVRGWSVHAARGDWRQLLHAYRPVRCRQRHRSGPRHLHLEPHWLRRAGRREDGRRVDPQGWEGHTVPTVPSVLARATTFGAPTGAALASRSASTSRSAPTTKGTPGKYEKPNPEPNATSRRRCAAVVLAAKRYPLLCSASKPTLLSGLPVRERDLPQLLSVLHHFYLLATLAGAVWAEPSPGDAIGHGHKPYIDGIRVYVRGK
jgi:hypothetical protein